MSYLLFLSSITYMFVILTHCWEPLVAPGTLLKYKYFSWSSLTLSMSTWFLNSCSRCWQCSMNWVLRLVSSQYMSIRLYRRLLRKLVCYLVQGCHWSLPMFRRRLLSRICVALMLALAMSIYLIGNSRSMSMVMSVSSRV